MQDEKISGEHVPTGTGDKKGPMTERHKRADTEHRGVTGTLVLTDVLDDKVRIPWPASPVLICGVEAVNSELCDSPGRLLFERD